jgi:hypothetical protein
MTLRYVLGVAAVAATWAVAEEASAASIDVAVAGCDWRVDELERLVRLELSSVLLASGPAPAYRVTIECSADRVHIQLDDPLTGKRLERAVAAPPADQPEPERVVALTVAQLYRASWLELVVEDDPPLAPADHVEASSEALESARRAVLPTLERARSEPHAWSVGLGGGVQLRHLQAPVVLPRIEAQVAWWPARRVWLFVGGGAEWASPERATGIVEALVVRGTAGIGVEPLARGDWSGFAELETGAAYTRFEGSDVPDGFETGSVSGAGFDGSVALGACLTVETLRIELLGRLGVLAWTPAGLVDGDDDVTLDGAWTGAHLRLRWAP